MQRRQWVELEDLSWFPAILRDGGTAFLSLAERLSGHAGSFRGVLADAMEAAGQHRLVDLCSGGGEPAVAMARALSANGHPTAVVLTDLFPNGPSMREVVQRAEGIASVEPVPVDARDVPASLTGFRTIFNAFHHFCPEDAVRVLQNAVDQRQPIGVFEVVSREWLMLFALLGSPITVSLTLPFWRPFRWPWLIWTYLLPVMQLFVLWDGVVSWLRVYGEDELHALVAQVNAPGWTWKIGRVQHGDAPFHGTYLIGLPPPGASPA